MMAPAFLRPASLPSRRRSLRTMSTARVTPGAWDLELLSGVVQATRAHEHEEDRRSSCSIYAISMYVYLYVYVSLSLSAHVIG